MAASGMPGSLTRGTPASAKTDVVTIVLSVWMIGGMFLDGYAHTYVIDAATEDFFTPWHGVLYSGFVVLAAWVALVGYRRRGPGGIVGWFPPAYKKAALGVLIFAVGAVGDGIWHTIFGVELGIDALLSPTHLLLLGGGSMLAWTPFWSLTDRGGSATWLAVWSALAMTALLSFLLQYLWFLPWSWYAEQPFDGASGEGEWVVVQFLGGALVVTLVFVVPLLVVAGRFHLPLGAATITWGVAQALESASFSRQVGPVVVAAGAGLVFDIVYRTLSRGRLAIAVASTVGPMALWGGYLLRTAYVAEVGWPPEVWGGVVFLTAATGLGMALLQESGHQRSTWTSDEPR